MPTQSSPSLQTIAQGLQNIVVGIGNIHQGMVEANGFILTAPDGSVWRISVTNQGQLITTPVTKSS